MSEPVETVQAPARMHLRSPVPGSPAPAPHHHHRATDRGGLRRGTDVEVRTDRGSSGRVPSSHPWCRARSCSTIASRRRGGCDRHQEASEAGTCSAVRLTILATSLMTPMVRPTRDEPGRQHQPFHDTCGLSWPQSAADRNDDHGCARLALPTRPSTPASQGAGWSWAVVDAVTPVTATLDAVMAWQGLAGGAVWQPPAIAITACLALPSHEPPSNPCPGLHAYSSQAH